MKTISDEEIIQDLQSSWKENLEYHEKKLAENKSNQEKLNTILESAKSWVPPTEDHVGLREFMIDQLEMTIKGDGDLSYHEELIMKIKEEMEEGIDPKVYREKRIKEIEERISYYEIEIQSEMERCKKSNDWMEKFFESIQTK